MQCKVLPDRYLRSIPLSFVAVRNSHPSVTFPISASPPSCTPTAGPTTPTATPTTASPTTPTPPPPTPPSIAVTLGVVWPWLLAPVANLSAREIVELTRRAIPVAFPLLHRLSLPVTPPTAAESASPPSLLVRPGLPTSRAHGPRGEDVVATRRAVPARPPAGRVGSRAAREQGNNRQFGVEAQLRILSPPSSTSYVTSSAEIKQLCFSTQS